MAKSVLFRLSWAWRQFWGQAGDAVLFLPWDAPQNRFDRVKDLAAWGLVLLGYAVLGDAFDYWGPG